MKPRRILILQMCRFGDILMTGPALRRLRAADPRAEISLMIMDSFGSVPLPSHLYDHLLLFPLGRLAGTIADPSAGWTAAVEQLRAFVHDLASAPYDLVVNLAHTEVSALVASLIPARARRGVVTTPQRQLAIEDGWTTYVRASSRSRETAAFHLADLFSWISGVGCDAGGLEVEVPPADAVWADGWMREHHLASPPIAMQLGASDVSKQWPVARFAALADLLPEEWGEIVLIGSDAERHLAQQAMAGASRRLIDATGTSSLSRVGALLRRSRLLVTNDTGPMHVATAVGTRVVDLSMGPVSAHETGPYGEGHVVIEPRTACYPCPVGAVCHHHACRGDIPAADVAAVVRYALGEGPLPRIEGARVLQSHRAASGRLVFSTVDDGFVTERDRVRLAAAAMWEQTLDTPAPIGSLAGHGQGFDAPGLGSARPGVLTMCDVVAQEADGAATLVKSMAQSTPNRQRAIAESVYASLERLLAMGEVERATHAIVTFLRYELESIRAGDLRGLTRAQAAAYAGAARRARLLGARLREQHVDQDTVEEPPSARVSA